MSTTLLDDSAKIFPTVQMHRQHLHAHPELSFQELETCAYIQRELSALGIPHRVVARTGVVAHIGTGTRCVALRADIDALPITENTGLPYTSTVPGVMHACGHDTHTSMLLGAARLLKERESELGGVVKLLFQPGEEKTPGGASIMIAEGALEDPVPEIIFGQHINPDSPAGRVEFVAGSMMAAADELYWEITGFGAHAAQPHKGHNPIMAATALVQHLQSLITQSRNPLDAGVVTVTALHGGHATNVIPDTVEMKGTLRSFNPAWREHAWQWLEDHTRRIAELYGCHGHLRIEKGYPPLVNDAAATSFARSVAESLLGIDNVGSFEPKMWGEDFAYYSQMMPACFWMLGGRPHTASTMPGLHNAAFAPDESAMIHGAALLAQVAVQALQR